MDRWSGRVALVTGASTGIGAAICRALVESGVRVIGAARNKEQIQKLSDELKESKGSLYPIRCDLTKDAQVIDMFEEIKTNFGGVDICINNAGCAVVNNLVDGSPTEWRDMLELNVVALCLCTKLAILSMRERNVEDEHIIHISSMAAYRVAAPDIAFYACTKHAVRALADGLRMQLRASKSQIRVTCISPGWVETEFFGKLYGTDAAKKHYSAYKCIQASDVADLVVTALSAPAHVEINDLLVRPTVQPS